MYNKFASRFAMTGMMMMAAGLSLKAQAPAPTAPTVAFSIADGTTVHKSTGLLLVGIAATDAVGLQSVSASVGWSSMTANYSAGTKSTLSRMYFFAGYMPVGDYTFRASAFNTSGGSATQTVTVHLVP